MGNPEIYFYSRHTTTAKRMIAKAHKLLDEADVVIHYNGTKFDIPTLNQAFVQYGMSPPAPFKEVDLLRVVKGRFRFPSNKLEYVAKALGVGAKIKHSGHELWIRCMAGDKDAWEEMKEYNINDVLITEGVYEKLRPWIRSHPNTGLYENNPGHRCPTCGGDHLQRRGYSRTGVSLFARFQCQSCGSWSREATSETTTEVRRSLMRPA